MKRRFQKIIVIIQVVFIIWLIYLNVNADEIIYRNMVREVENNNLLGGLYDPWIDRYVCSDQSSCEHERGHDYDASGASENWLFEEWRSANPQFHKNVDIIYSCMIDFFGNNNDSKHRNLSKNEVFMAAYIDMSRYSTEEWENDKEKPYREIYASSYAIMKLHRWDIYHYKDVEDMISQRAEYCHAIQNDIIASHD